MVPSLQHALVAATSKRRGVSVNERLTADQSGSVATTFALTIVCLACVVGLAVDYARARSVRETMQSAADAGALAGASELSLADFKRENVSEIVKSVVGNYVKNNDANGVLKGAGIEAAILENPLQVQVKLSKTVDMYFGGFFGVSSNTYDVVSVARIVGRPNICVLTLEPSEPAAVLMTNQAKLTGNDCAVFSNSDSTLGMTVMDGASMVASAVCSAGGVKGNGEIEPTALQDCPQFTDPLESRPEPSDAGCDHVAKVVAASTVTLRPGVYCLGLTIAGLSRVTFEPGIYVIKNGPFLVAGSAEITGMHVGFYLSGLSFFTFDPLTKIELTAPVDGPMAGLLFFGSRSQSNLLLNTILSDRAQTMTGTIYLPKATLVVKSLARVGAQSAYTAIVARRLLLMDGPHLILNANYSETDVPVPESIRGAGLSPALVK